MGVGALAALALATLGVPAAAGAATKTVGFEEHAAGTTITDQYRDSRGVYWRGQAAGDGFAPVVRDGAGVQQSGTKVADWATCVAVPPATFAESCGEGFYHLRSRGQLNPTATSVSVYVGEDQLPPIAEVHELACAPAHG